MGPINLNAAVAEGGGGKAEPPRIPQSVGTDGYDSKIIRRKFA